MGSRAIPKPTTNTDRWYEIKTQVHTKLLGSLTPDQLKGLNKDSIRAQIANVIERLVQNEGTPMTVAERDRVTEEILDEVFGLGPLEQLLKDADVGNGFTRGAWVKGVIGALDTNADKTIDWDEFSAAVK